MLNTDSWRQPQLAPQVTTLLKPVGKDEPDGGVGRISLNGSEEGSFVVHGLGKPRWLSSEATAAWYAVADPASTFTIAVR